MMDGGEVAECNVTKRARTNPKKGKKASLRESGGTGLKKGILEQRLGDKREPKRRETGDRSVGSGIGTQQGGSLIILETKEKEIEGEARRQELGGKEAA